MEIREIQEKDNAAIEKIIKTSLKSFGLDIPGTAYFDPQLSKLAQFYKNLSKAKYWVAVNEQNKVVGGIGIGPFGEKTDVGELQKLYITPAIQGIGLSKKLMRVALTFAKEHYTYCYIETSTKLFVANQLYVKFGFHELEEPLAGSDHDTMDKWYIKRL